MASSKKLVQRMVFLSHYLYERKKVKSLISKPYLLELCVKHCGSQVSRSHCQKYIFLKWHPAGNLWREWLSGSWPHIYPTNHVHLHWELKAAAPTHDVKGIFCYYWRIFFLLLLKNILWKCLNEHLYKGKCTLHMVGRIYVSTHVPFTLGVKKNTISMVKQIPGWTQILENS